MKLLKRFKNAVGKARLNRAVQKVALSTAASEIGRDDWPRSLTDPTEFYLECVRFFYQKLPQDLRDHRRYFNSNNRGFGEDAFHVMWFLLYREFEFSRFLEIGVYRGQVLSLVSLLQQGDKRVEVVGISPFAPAGDSVSNYTKDVSYYEDTLENFRHFSLPLPTLARAYSTDEIARATIASRQWECIYIDGNHDYEVAKSDWNLCSMNLIRGGIIVLDDSGLDTSFRAPIFATAGHPGPTRVAAEIDRQQFREILQVGHNRVFQKI
ncbi:MAG: class SAM-dependent methyltransferase [Verrucomicrobiales bacterium]|nr:class SAM-dependent methyltransferase [Verrucomicrobiales bacterium]